MKGTLALLLMLTALLGKSEMSLAAEPSAKPSPGVDSAQERKTRPFKKTLDDILEELPNIKRDLKAVKSGSANRERKMVSFQHGSASATLVFEGSDMAHLDEITIAQFASSNTTIKDASVIDALTSTLLYSLFDNPQPSSPSYIVDFMDSEMDRQMNILLAGGKPKAAHKEWAGRLRLTVGHRLVQGVLMSSYTLQAI